MIERNKIYNESCLDTMARMVDKEIDLTLTDPPYAIGLKYKDYDDTEENWYKLMEKVLPEIIRVSKMAILPSCQIRFLPWFYKNFPPTWLMCWYKGSTGHASAIGFNDWEPHLVYGRLRNQMHMHDYFQTESSPAKDTYGHPCPKPMDWAEHLISKVARDDKILVYDPFMGSGTTAIAARFLGHQYVGSELSKEYCDIIDKRLRKAPGNNKQTEILRDLFGES